MNWLQTVRMAFKSILNNKVRSILTMLGIIIGVASVIAIVSSIQGTSKLQRLQYEAMGVNRIDVFGYGGRSKDWKDFEEYLDTELADKVSAWSPQINTMTGRATASNTGRKSFPTIPITTAGLICISATSITER